MQRNQPAKPNIRWKQRTTQEVAESPCGDILDWVLHLSIKIEVGYESLIRVVCRSGVFLGNVSWDWCVVLICVGEYVGMYSRLRRSTQIYLVHMMYFIS